MTANPLNWLLGDASDASDFIHQDFTGMPDGTPVNGMVTESGQTIVLDTVPYTAVNTATVQNGAVASSGLMYAVLPVPWADVVASVEYTFPAGAVGSEHAVCIALGKRDASGHIITGKMVHVPVAFQQKPFVSLWGSAYGVAPNAVLSETSFNRPPLTATPPGYSTPAAGQKTRMDVTKIGNQLFVSIDGGRCVTSYYDDEIHGMSGDSSPGQGDGYLYFEIFPTPGGTSPLPVINSISARKAGPGEAAIAQQSAVKPNISWKDALDLYVEKPIPAMAATGLFKVTPVNGQTPTSLKVRITATPDGTEANLLQEITEWDLMVGYVGGVPTVIKNVVTSPYAPTSRFVGDVAPNLASQTYTDTIVSGSDIWLRSYPLITGSDSGTVTNVNVQVEVEVRGYPLVPVAL